MSFLDGIFSAGADERRRAQESIDSVGVPTLDQLRIQLEQLVLQGELRPEEAQTILQEQSAYETIETDPRLRGSQLGSLSELEKIGQAGGLDARARATLDDALAAQRTASRGDQGAIIADARQRGIYGSDVETVNRLLAASGAATRGSRAALDSAALAEQRRYAAITDAATLGGNIRQQDFSEASRRADAIDAINRFNAAQRQDVELANVRTRNQAQATNLGARQAVSDANVGIRNEQNTYNSRLPLTVYDLQMGQAQGRADYQRGEAAAEAQRNKNIGNTIQSIGSLVAGAYTGGASGALTAAASSGSGGTGANTYAALAQRDTNVPSTNADMQWLDELSRRRATYGY